MSRSTLRNVVEYAIAGFLEIFRPNDEEYSAVGIQPYSGKIYRHSRFDW